MSFSPQSFARHGSPSPTFPEFLFRAFASFVFECLGDEVMCLFTVFLLSLPCFPPGYVFFVRFSSFLRVTAQREVVRLSSPFRRDAVGSYPASNPVRAQVPSALPELCSTAFSSFVLSLIFTFRLLCVACPRLQAPRTDPCNFPFLPLYMSCFLTTFFFHPFRTPCRSSNCLFSPVCRRSFQPTAKSPVPFCFREDRYLSGR